MFSAKKQMMIDGPSFYQDSNRKFFNGDNIDSYRGKLTANLTKIIELFRERKQLIMKMAEIMIAQNASKLDHIAKAKMSDLRNQSRSLKDQVTLNLIQNAQRYGNNANKSILQTIIDSNVKNIESDQTKKTKFYYDEINRIDAQRTSTMNKFKIQSAQLSKFIDQERRYFRDIQMLEQQKISILTSKTYDHIKKAEKIEDQIEKIKLLLKSNNTNKDKKKRQISHQIDKIIEVTKKHENIAQKRYNQIIEMFGGYESIEQFDQFFRNFQIVVANKVEGKRDDQKYIKEIIKLANYFQAEIEDLQKLSLDQLSLFQELSEAYKKNVTLAILQRAYLSNLPQDRNALLGIVNRCQVYRGVLDRLSQQKGKAKREIEKALKVLDYFEPELKAILTEQKRKEELKQKILRIMSSKVQLQKLQRKQKNFQFQLSNLLLQKQAFVQQQQQSAKKGNLSEYKQRSSQLQKLEQQIQGFTQNKNSYRYNQQQSKITIQIQQLNRQYSDIIQEILIDEKEMSYFTFLQKLHKRLSIV